MIAGAHTLLYAKDVDAARAFFRDVLELDCVDAGHGWLIFELPPAALPRPPPDDPVGGVAKLYLMCPDVEATRAELEGRGVEFVAPISEAGFGRLRHLRVPRVGEV